MMKGSGIRQGKKRITAKIRGYLLAVAVIVSLMAFGSSAFAGLDSSNNSQQIVSYDTNGGSIIYSESVPFGGTVVLLARTSSIPKLLLKHAVRAILQRMALNTEKG